MASITADGPDSKRPPQMVLVEAEEEEDVVMMLRLPGWNTVKRTVEHSLRTAIRTAVVPLAILTITGTLATPQAAWAEQIVAATGETGPAPACDPAAAKVGLKMLGVLVETTPPCQHALPTTTTLDGAPVSLDAWRGKVVLVNLWATWCQPCLREMPSLLQAQKALGGADFQIIAISQDLGGIKQVGPYLSRNNLDGLEVLLDPGTTAGKAFHAPGLPVSILLGRDGRQIARLTGEADWASEAMLEKLRRLIAAGA